MTFLARPFRHSSAPVSSSRFPVLGSRFPVSGFGFRVSSSRFPVPNAKPPMNGKYLLSIISYLLSIISNSTIACPARRAAQPRARAGQAMVEFVVAILAIVIIIAGFFQMMEIVGARGKILRSIRGEVGKKALSPGILIDRPDYISDWNEGEDEVMHTTDDKAEQGSISVTLGAGVVEHSVPNSGDWNYLDGVVNANLPSLRGGLSATALGLVHEKETQKIELMPAMRDWIVGKEYVLVGSELWMPRLKLGEFDQ